MSQAFAFRIVNSERSIDRTLANCGLVPFEGRLLLAHVLSKDRTWIAAHGDAPLAALDAKAFGELARRRRNGEPVAYLVGRREFYGLDLSVDSDVLIPRPETELVVELALERIDPGSEASVLDLGTGCGAIALAIARERPRARIVGLDLSPAALAIARRNAGRLGLQNVEFVLSDWYQSLPNRNFSAIVANPPYVASEDAHLSEGDLRFEPRAALTPGADGLAAIRAIVGGAGTYLEQAGWLFTEHGYDQRDAVRSLLQAAGFDEIESRRDLAGIPRVSFGRYLP